MLTKNYEKNKKSHLAATKAILHKAIGFCNVFIHYMNREIRNDLNDNMGGMVGETELVLSSINNVKLSTVETSSD